MTWAPTSKRRAYLALAALGAIAGIALRRPELAILAVPFAALAAAAPATAPHIDLRRATVAPDRTLEGERVVATLELEIAGPVASVEAEPVTTGPFELSALRFMRGSTPIGRSDSRSAPAPVERASRRNEASVAVHPPTSVLVAVELRARRWGAHRVGAVVLRAHDRAGMAVAERRVELNDTVRVLPREETLRALIAPSGTQPAPGDWPSRRRGGGTELAEIRPFVPGDSFRAINWRATARRGEPFVTERRAERTAEVVLFLDTFADVAGTTIERAVRAALALAREHLGRRDRVGVVGFGGATWWLPPDIGRGQVVRIVDALLQSQVIANVAWHDVRHLPRRALPPQATVIAITPLTDDRTIAALADLARRRFDVAILEVEPRSARPATPSDAVADMLWALERDDLRARFARAGAHCVRWQPGRPLPAAIEELNAYRRQPVRR